MEEISTQFKRPLPAQADDPKRVRTLSSDGSSENSQETASRPDSPVPDQALLYHRRMPCTPVTFPDEKDQDDLTDFFRQLESISNENLTVYPEKSTDFFEHYQTRFIGDTLAVRQFQNNFTKISRVDIRKNNIGTNPSIISFPSTDTRQFLSKALVPLVKKIKDSTLDELFGKEACHQVSDPNFFEHPITKVSPCGSIFIRPFQFKSDIRLYVRLWQKVPSHKAKTMTLWNGPIITISVELFFQLLKVLNDCLQEFESQSIDRSI